MAGKSLFAAADYKLLQRILASESDRNPSLVRGKATYWLGLSVEEEVSDLMVHFLNQHRFNLICLSISLSISPSVSYLKFGRRRGFVTYGRVSGLFL